MRQPQTTRQQFSACGACRTRRIRCDLKDICEDALLAGETPACSTCQERDLICTYEFNDMKAAKILRRGRRIKQVEAMYGKQNSQSPTESRGQSPLTPHPGERLYTFDLIPKLKPQFFDSPFWRCFHVQRPILDPTEFAGRYREYYLDREGEDKLGLAGHLIAALLVIWAASFGVDESGCQYSAQGPNSVTQWHDRTNELVREALERVDSLGLLRKPSWDGVRALLLLLPLTQDVLSRTERQVMHESTMSQVCTLCSFSSSQELYVDYIVRARIFWYAHTQEGVTSGPKGARIFLFSDDLSAFQATIPPPSGNLEYGVVDHTFQYDLAYRLATTPIRISEACRQIHSYRKRGNNNQEIVKSAFTTLDMSWFELDQFHRLDTKGVLQQEDRNRFICTWKIIIFECFYTVAESLSQFEDDVSPFLASMATRKCRELLPHLIAILRPLLNTSFFAFDSGLAQRGVICAALILARTSDSEFQSRKEAFDSCLQALRQMRWAYSGVSKTIEKLGQAWSDDRSYSPIDGIASSCIGGPQYLLTPPITPTLAPDQNRRVSPPAAYPYQSAVTPASSWSTGSVDLNRRSPTSAIYLPVPVPSYDCISPTSASPYTEQGFFWPKYELE